MFFIVIYIIAFIVLCIIHRKRSIFSHFLCVIYLVSAIAGLILKCFCPHVDYVEDTKDYSPLVFLFFVILLWIVPYSKMDNKVSLMSISRKRFNQLAIITGWTFLPVTILLLYNAFNILTSVDVSVFRVEEDYYSYFIGGKFFSLGAWMAGVSYIPHILFFLSFLYNTKLLTKVLLFIGSLSFAAMTLCFAGRDGIVYWILNSAVLYMICKNSYNDEVKSSLKKVLYISGGIIAMLLLFITVYRFVFSYIESESVIEPILSYIGQPVHIFSQAFSMGHEAVSKLDKTSYLTYTFGTFVHGIWSKYGLLALFLFTFVHFLLSRTYVIEFNKNHCIYDLFIIYTLYQIPFYGVFYYRQGIQQLDLTYVVFIVLCVIYKNIRKARV